MLASKLKITMCEKLGHNTRDYSINPKNQLQHDNVEVPPPNTKKSEEKNKVINIMFVN